MHTYTCQCDFEETSVSGLYTYIVRTNVLCHDTDINISLPVYTNRSIHRLSRLLMLIILRGALLKCPWAYSKGHAGRT